MYQKQQSRDTEVMFEITKHIGTISVSPSGWRKELNIVRWNEGSEKYDIRDWDETHTKLSRGITLRQDELETLKTILAEL